MKEKRRRIGALLTAMFFWGPLQEQSQSLAEIAR